MFHHSLTPTPAGHILALCGDLDTQAAHELDVYLEDIVGTLTGEITIDLTDLTYLNSTGIRSFIRLNKLLKASGKTFGFTGVNAKIFRIFRYCGLDTFFTFQHQVEVVPVPPLATEDSRA